jgi:hypothetical protein
VKDYNGFSGIARPRMEHSLAARLKRLLTSWSTRAWTLRFLDKWGALASDALYPQPRKPLPLHGVSISLEQGLETPLRAKSSHPAVLAHSTLR